MSALLAVLLPMSLLLLFPAPDPIRRWAIRLTPWSGLLLVWPMLGEPSVSFSAPCSASLWRSMTSTVP